MACFNAVLAIVEEGDEVVIPSPYWVSYPEMVRLAGGVPVIVETKESDGWKLTPKQFEEAMSPRTKMIILTHRLTPPARSTVPENCARSATSRSRKTS